MIRGFERCPHPECNEQQSLILNSHCISSHGKSKKELIQEYGEKELNSICPDKLRENMKKHNPHKLIEYYEVQK